jgi:hypothetical protein
MLAFILASLPSFARYVQQQNCQMNLPHEFDLLMDIDQGILKSCA